MIVKYIWFSFRVVFKVASLLIMEFTKFLKFYLSFPLLINKFKLFTINQKIVFVLCLIVLLCIYFVSNYGLPSFNSGYIKTSSLDMCLTDRLKLLKSKLNEQDAVYFHTPLNIDEQSYIQFIGNGYFGCAWQEQGKLFIKFKNTLSLSVNLFPLMTLSLPLGYYVKEINTLDFTDGAVNKIQCFKMENSLCVSSTLTAYAHRTRPSVLVQEIEINNPTKKLVTLRFSKCDYSGWIGATISTRYIRHVIYRLITGSVRSKDKKSVYLVMFAEPHSSLSYSLKGGETLRSTQVSGIRYYGPLNTFEEHNDTLARDALESTLLNELEEALTLDEKKLRAEHVSAWRNLWTSGLSISHSLAPGAVNGNHINATIYYLLSQVHLSPSNRSAKLGWRPGGCYNGHHTIQVPTLWSTPKDEASLSELINRWLITLMKQGCAPLVQLGAQGIVQALLMSIGQFLHTRDHLEFGMPSSDLHRDYKFRNLHYAGGTLNVSVAVGEDNRPTLFVAGRSRDSSKEVRPLFACDAGCLDPPVQLNDKKYTKLPVKLTRPHTALLYVTQDKSHMEELKNAIHVREIMLAPAHEHHIMALHKHGHPYGGLPLFFWIFLVLLLVVFHLFLAKLIYKEYWKGESIIPAPSNPRAAYYRSRHRAV